MCRGGGSGKAVTLTGGISMSVHENPEKQEYQRESDTSIPEWIVASVGLILVVSAVSFLLYQAVTQNPSSPDVRVQVESVVPLRSGYLVKIKIINYGDTTAEGLIVEGELSKDEKQIELSHTEIDYAPAHAEKRGGLFFSHDPRQGELRVRALGYEEP
jgi:uncharacterized protein (TIGR02588 family)